MVMVAKSPLYSKVISSYDITFSPSRRVRWLCLRYNYIGTIHQDEAEAQTCGEMSFCKRAPRLILFLRMSLGARDFEGKIPDRVSFQANMLPIHQREMVQLKRETCSLCISSLISTPTRLR